MCGLSMSFAMTMSTRTSFGSLCSLDVDCVVFELLSDGARRRLDIAVERVLFVVSFNSLVMNLDVSLTKIS